MKRWLKSQSNIQVFTDRVMQHSKELMQNSEVLIKTITRNLNQNSKVLTRD